MHKYAIILLCVSSIPAIAEVVNVTPDKLDFGNQVVGTNAYQIVTLANPTKKTLNISSIMAGNDFNVVYQDCSSVVPAGYQCSIYVQFSPTTVGLETVTLIIADDAANSPQKVKMSGTGIPVQMISINVTPGGVSKPLGLQQQFTATGVFNNGYQQDLTNSVTWNSSAPTVAGINSSGLAFTASQGVTTISAAQDALSGSTQFSVTAPAVQSITVSPSNATIPKGLTQQFTATATLTNHTVVDITSAAQWASSFPSIISVNAIGLGSALSHGTSTISATFGGVAGSVVAAVYPPVITSLMMSPTNYSVGVGTSHQFTLTGTFSDSSTSDLTSRAIWSSSNTDIATVSGGLVRSDYRLGSTTIGAQVVDTNGATLSKSANWEVAFFSGHMNLSSPRSGHTAAVLGSGKVLLTGGAVRSGQALASTDIFDPMGFITPGPPMNVARQLHTATTLPDGKVLIVGGGYNVLSCELYDPTSQSFVLTGDLNVSRISHTATLLNNGKVLIAGGYSPTAELYDPATGIFTLTGSMAVLRTGHTATLLNDGRVLIAGGSPYSTMVEVYDPATGLFTAGGTLSTDRSYHAAARLADGRVLIVGGQSGWNYTASADVYDPATGTITATSPMHFTRAFHTATLLSNGQVLVAGGYNGNWYGGPDTTVERFDPTSGTFAGWGDMATYPTSGVRVNHTATLLANGQVLLAGGYDQESTAEIYQPSIPNPPGLQ